MSDNLRDRIAATLDRDFNPDQYPIMAAMFRDYAQAIIDEFALTVEECPCVFDCKETRAVGKWAKQ